MKNLERIVFMINIISFTALIILSIINIWIEGSMQTVMQKAVYTAICVQAGLIVTWVITRR